METGTPGQVGRYVLCRVELVNTQGPEFVTILHLSMTVQNVLGKVMRTFIVTPRNVQVYVYVCLLNRDARMFMYEHIHVSIK